MNRCGISKSAFNLFWRKSSHCLFTAMAVEQHLVLHSPAPTKRSNASGEAEDACGRFETGCSTYTRKNPLINENQVSEFSVIPHWQLETLIGVKPYSGAIG
jgi:hypothetical protein